MPGGFVVSGDEQAIERLAQRVAVERLGTSVALELTVGDESWSLDELGAAHGALARCSRSRSGDRLQTTTRRDRPARCLSAVPRRANVFGWTLDERSRSPSSTPMPRRAATSSTPPTRIRRGYRGIARRRLRGDHRRLDGVARQPRRDRHRDEGRQRARVQRALSAQQVRAGAEASLRSLRTDRIDLYYAHIDDPGTPLEETLAAFDALVRDGPRRRDRRSRTTAPSGCERALAIVEREGYARIAALQPQYNLVERRLRARAAADLRAPGDRLRARTSGSRAASSPASTALVATSTASAPSARRSTSSTSAVRACSRRSTRSPRRAGWRLRRSRSHGSRRSRPWSRRSRARARQSSWPSCCRSRSCGSSDDELRRLDAASAG